VFPICPRALRFVCPKRLGEFGFCYGRDRVDNWTAEWEHDNWRILTSKSSITIQRVDIQFSVTLVALSTNTHRLQTRMYVKKGQSWDRTTFSMDKELYHWEKNVLESTS
jgi:hypothetical protein